MDYYYCKANGLCVVCYSPLSEQDRRNYCVRCKTCRELMQASAKQEKQQKKAQQEALWESKLRRCYECEFSTDCGGVLYCLAADGTCLKKDIDPNFGKPDEETDQGEEEQTNA